MNTYFQVSSFEQAFVGSVEAPLLSATVVLFRILNPPVLQLKSPHGAVVVGDFRKRHVWSAKSVIQMIFYLSKSNKRNF